MDLQLREALEKDDVGRVAQLARDGMDINHGGLDGVTPLMLAAWWGRLDTLHTLLENGADPRAKDNDGYDLLYYAMESHCTIETLQLLLQSGTDVNGSWPVDSVLVRAAMNTNAEIVDALLKAGARVNDPGGNGFTALMSAAMRGDAEMTRLLLAAGAEVNRLNRRRESALDLALRYNEASSVIALLIAAGATTRSRSPAGKSAVQRAIQNDKLDLLKNSLDWDNSLDIGEAAAIGDLDRLTTLLEAGADLETGAARQGTPLWWAAFANHVAAARLLLSRGANVNAATERKSTPLICAAGRGNLEMIRMLITYGADLDANSVNGDTALTEAIRNQRTGIVRLLVACGASPNGAHGCPPLCVAASRGDAESIGILLAAGANLHAVDARGSVALHGVRSAEMARLLLAAGADKDFRDRNGMTPLMLAAKMGQEEVVEALLSAGADPTLRDTKLDWTAEEWTANQWAKAFINPRILDLLRGAR